jgi:putative FmdB family regulatory protein
LKVFAILQEQASSTMPIYAYKCDSCGFAKDVLQKISDAPLSPVPVLPAPSFKKQVTAAGFQLKGSGWYATDFKGGNNGAPRHRRRQAFRWRRQVPGRRQACHRTTEAAAKKAGRHPPLRP